MIKLLLILPCLFVMFQPLNAKVDPPNYDFSLTTLDDFFPGKKIEEIEKKYGKAETVNSVQGMATKKFFVSQLRYKFPVLVQDKDGAVADVFAKLPSYFLHDIFLHSIVKRLGKQTTYKRILEEAFYVWEKDNLRYVYSASCTITCFPIFYAVEPKDKTFATLMDQMKSAMKK